MLDEIFEDAHAFVVRLLEAGDGVLEVLNLGLQLDHVLVYSVGLRKGDGKYSSEREVTDGRMGEDAHRLCVPLERLLGGHSPLDQLRVASRAVSGREGRFST